MARKRLGFFVLPLIIAAFSLLGGLYGPRIPVASAATDPEVAERVLDNEVDNFAKVYALIEQNYAEPENTEKANNRDTKPSKHRTLDPHSNFFDPNDYQAVLEDQQGKYYGGGMSVSPRNGKTVVIAPFPGSPAYKAGHRPGDIIVFVNAKPTDGLTT